MVWHIVAKDVRQLRWPLAAVVAVHAIQTVARVKVAVLADPSALSAVAGLPGSLLTLLITGLLIALVVQQDTTTDTSQDWLVRPIRRRDLIFAKVVFVVAFVHVPLLLLDAWSAASSGFPPASAFGAATTRAVYLFVTFTIPALGIATVTSNITQLVVALIAWVVVLVAMTAGATLVLEWSSPTAQSGLAWVPTVGRQALMAGAAAFALVVQYVRRRTNWSRAVLLGAVVASQALTFLPWPIAYAIERNVSRGSASSDALSVAFESSAARFRPALGQNINDIDERPGVGPMDVAAENERRRAEDVQTIFLPVAFGGLPAGAIGLVDRSEVRLLNADGVVIHRGVGNDLQVRQTGDDGDLVTTHHGVRIPGVVFRLASAPITLEVEYWLTLFREKDGQTLPASSGERLMPGLGRCAAGRNRAGTAVQLRCVAAGERPPCLIVSLQHPQSGRRNPDVPICAPDYTPFAGHAIPDAMSRYGGALRFSDPAGLARFPVSGRDVDEAVVLIKSYVPDGHVQRRLSIRAITLSDWLPDMSNGL